MIYPTEYRSDVFSEEVWMGEQALSHNMSIFIEFKDRSRGNQMPGTGLQGGNGPIVPFRRDTPSWIQGKKTSLS